MYFSHQIAVSFHFGSRKLAFRKMVQSYGGTENELRQRSVDASAKPLTTTDEGRKVDQLLDEHQT
jgi:hypothetical protein